MPGIAILFARADSIYKQLGGLDVYDAERDARTYRGGSAVIAHPPCRAWGRLRTFARPVVGEKELAHFAVGKVRAGGGVLEHPAGSLLWREANLPLPGQVDTYGGWTLVAPQQWWGHRAEKNSWFYIVGCSAAELPPIPFVLGDATHVVQSRKRSDYRPHITKAEREHTPKPLAEWLLNVAAICAANMEARRCQVH